MNWIDQMNEDMARRREESKKIDQHKIKKNYAAKTGLEGAIRNNPNHQSNAGKEGGKVGGKINGPKVVHTMIEKTTFEHRSIAGKKGGSITGRKNVESGHMDNVRLLVIENKKIRKESECKELYDLIPFTDWFKILDVIKLNLPLEHNNRKYGHLIRTDDIHYEKKFLTGTTQVFKKL